MTAPSPRLRDRLCVAGFCLAWLLPLALHGLTRAPLRGEPPLLHRAHDLALLPDEAPRVWNTHHVELRRLDSGEWESYADAHDFTMRPFGRRTRLDLLLAQWGLDHARGREALAWRIASRAQEAGERPIIEVRFLWSWAPARPDAPPQGAYAPPQVRDIPPERRRVVSLHDTREYRRPPQEDPR